MVDTLQPTKGERIKTTLRETKERRKGQTCHVYELKVDLSSLSDLCHESLQRLFHEARWFYNAILGSNNIFKFDTRVRQVEVKTPEGFETRDLTLLSRFTGDSSSASRTAIHTTLAPHSVRSSFRAVRLRLLL